MNDQSRTLITAHLSAAEATAGGDSVASAPVMGRTGHRELGIADVYRLDVSTPRASGDASRRGEVTGCDCKLGEG